MCHLHQTCPCYQTLHYYFRKCPTPLCKSIHSIDKLKTDSIDYTLSFKSDLSMLSDSTLLSSKIPRPTVQIHTFHQSSPNGICNLYISCNLYYHFERKSPLNQSISYFIYIRPVRAIRLYTNIFENAPPHCTNPYIPSIICKRIILIIHYNLH